MAIKTNFWLSPKAHKTELTTITIHSYHLRWGLIIDNIKKYNLHINIGEIKTKFHRNKTQCIELDRTRADQHKCLPHLAYMNLLCI